MKKNRKIKRFLLVEAQKLWEMEMPEYNTRIPVSVAHPIGLIQLASVISQRDRSAEVAVVDLRLLKHDYRHFLAFAKEWKPDFAGFRTVSRDSSVMNDFVKQFRDILPEAVLAAGGPHASAIREKIMDEAPLDFAVYGEGERTLVHLLDQLEEGGGFEKVKGLIYRDSSGQVHVNEPREFIEDLDSLPMPAWGLLDHEEYFKMKYFPHIPAYLNARRELAPLFTSRGCPFNCTFCHSIFGKKFRAQSPQRVLKEIELLYHVHGIRQFDIRDDIFNRDKKRVHEICDLIIKKGLDIKISFPNGLRADIMDEELVLKLKAAGMFRCTYALESASPRIQKLTRKNINLEKLHHIIHFTSARDIITRIFVMMGFPTETREELKQTIDFALDPAIDQVLPFAVNPFEGTEMSRTLEKEGVDTSKFRDRLDYLSIEFSVSEVSHQEVQAIKDDFIKRFYTEQRLNEINRKLLIHTSRTTGKIQ